MFRQLHIKMTLINAAVTIFLFIILISGVCILLEFNSQSTTDYVLTKITKNVTQNNMVDLPPRNMRDNDSEEKHPGIFAMPHPSFFFVKTDAIGIIVHKSSDITVDNDTLSKLVQATVKSTELRDDIEFAAIPFSYLKTPLPNGGFLIVFDDQSEERTIFHTTVSYLILAGLFCTLLSFLASFFMAKHVIKPIQYATTQQKKFVANASHELRTPITIMQTNLDIMKGAPPGDTLDNNRKWLNNLQGETTRMTELINSLLFLARADANQQLLEKEYFSLNNVVEGAVTAFELLAAEKEITLETKVHDVSITGLGDPARIKQVLTILIDNALRHTPPNGKITTNCYNTIDTSVINVIDTGEGIAEEDIAKIFDRFYQADSSRQRGGAGLGLSMAKWIIKRHKGTLKVFSKIGEGTTFTIKLPRNAI